MLIWLECTRWKQDKYASHYSSCGIFTPQLCNFFFQQLFFPTFNFDWGIPRRESVLFTFLRDKLHCQFARHSYSKSSVVQFFTHFYAPIPQTLFRLGLNVKTLCFRRLLFPPRFQSAASGVLRAFRMKFVVESRGKKTRVLLERNLWKSW